MELFLIKIAASPFAPLQMGRLSFFIRSFDSSFSVNFPSPGVSLDSEIFDAFFIAEIRSSELLNSTFTRNLWK